MTTPTPAWQAPEPEAGPASRDRVREPGIEAGRLHPRHRHPVPHLIMLATADGRLRAIFVPLGALFALAIIVVSIGYFPYFWAEAARPRGMNAMKIKVVRDADGGPVYGGRRRSCASSAWCRHRGLLHRRHLDLHRQAKAWLAGPHRRHGRRRGPARRLRLLTARFDDPDARSRRRRWYPDRPERWPSG